MGDEPELKKAKVDNDVVAEEKKKEWKDHTLNIADALMKSVEGEFLHKIADGPVTDLQGLADRAERVMSVLKVKTVKDLAEYKFYKMAKAITVLKDVEKEGKRPDGSVMNIDNAVVKDYENKSLADICDAPLSALQGISADTSELMSELGVDTVGKLGEWKFCVWAEAIVTLAEHEVDKTAAQRRQENMLKKLE